MNYAIAQNYKTRTITGCPSPYSISLDEKKSITQDDCPFKNFCGIGTNYSSHILIFESTIQPDHHLIS